MAPERRSRARTPVSRRYSRTALITVVALLAIFAAVGGFRIVASDPSRLELVA